MKTKDLSHNSSALAARVRDLIARRGELLAAAGFEAEHPASGAGLSAPEYARATRALLRLQRGLTGERELVGALYMEDAELLSAYLLWYWPVSYAQAARAIRVSGIRPLRVLDLGSGPGPLAAAFADHGASELHLVDASGKALSLAERILLGSDSGPRHATRQARMDSPADPAPRVDKLVADLANLDPSSLGGAYDAIVFGHSLNELWRHAVDRIERRAALLRSLRRLLAPGGVFFYLEPALLSTSRDAIALRDALLAAGWSVVAPCPAGIPCPALAAGPGQTCHDGGAWDMPESVRELAARAKLDKDEVKASWFVLSPEARAPAAPAGTRRVVSEPMLNKAGRTRFLLCDARGRVPLSAAREDASARASPFFSLRRYDLIRVSSTLARPSGEGFGPETHVELVRE